MRFLYFHDRFSPYAGCYELLSSTSAAAIRGSWEFSSSASDRNSGGVSFSALAFRIGVAFSDSQDRGSAQLYASVDRCVGPSLAY